jgi:hypothetical protein
MLEHTLVCVQCGEVSDAARSFKRGHRVERSRIIMICQVPTYCRWPWQIMALRTDRMYYSRVSTPPVLPVSVQVI